MYSEMEIRDSPSKQQASMFQRTLLLLSRLIFTFSTLIVIVVLIQLEYTVINLQQYFVQLSACPHLINMTSK